LLAFGVHKVKKKIEQFEDLFIWQKAIEFVKEIYILTEKAGLKTDFGLKNQMRDAAVSIPTNIAEGFERRSRKEYLNFLNIAKGSAGEVRSLLFVAFKVNYIDEQEHQTFHEKVKFLSGSIANHMKAISNAEEK
jgi:four helix bundle protein